MGLRQRTEEYKWSGRAYANGVSETNVGHLIGGLRLLYPSQ